MMHFPIPLPDHHAFLSEGCHNISNEGEPVESFEKSINPHDGNYQILSKIQAKFDYCIQNLALRRKEILTAIEHYFHKVGDASKQECNYISDFDQVEDMIKNLNRLTSDHSQLWWNQLIIPTVSPKNTILNQLEESKEASTIIETDTILRGSIETLEWKIKSEELVLTIEPEFADSTNKQSSTLQTDFLERVKIAKFQFKQSKLLPSITKHLIDIFTTIKDITCMQIDFSCLDMNCTDFAQFLNEFQSINGTVPEFQSLRSLSLDLSQTLGADQTLGAIYPKMKNHLRYLELDLRWIEAVHKILDILNGSELSQLEVFRIYLSFSPITSDDANALTKILGKMSRLHYLDFQISDSEVDASNLKQIFNNLPDNLYGFKLNISKTQLNNEDGVKSLKSLGEAFRSQRVLETLDINLSQTRLTENDIICMSQGFCSVKNVERLYFRMDLSNNKNVTNKVIKEWVTNYLKNSKYCYLDIDLSNTKVDDEGVKQLYALENANCFKFNLSYNKVPKNTIDMIKKKVSSLKDSSVIMNGINIIENSFAYWDSKNFRSIFFGLNKEENDTHTSLLTSQDEADMNIYALSDHSDQSSIKPKNAFHSSTVAIHR